jgi:hypothetical protein
MEKLETTLEGVKLERKELKPLREEPVYQGLRLVEDKVYGAGTSIKY